MGLTKPCHECGTLVNRMVNPNHCWKCGAEHKTKPTTH